jgi:hypothetical protein
VLINAHHPRADPVGELGDALPDLVLVPALDGGAADAVGELEFALTHPTVVGLKDLQSIPLGGVQSGSDAGKAVAKVAPAGLAMVFGRRQVQHQHLVAQDQSGKGIAPELVSSDPYTTGGLGTIEFAMKYS